MGRPNRAVTNPVCLSIEDNMIHNFKVKNNYITIGAVKPLEDKFRIENYVIQEGKKINLFDVTELQSFTLK